MKRILLLIILLLFPIYTSALTYPNLHYKSALIYDMTDNKLLYELNTKEQRSIASLTKIVTTITALESIDDLTDEVTITNSMLSKVRWDASIAGLKAGETYTYEDLLYASILPSGADATISLAISTSGSIDNFVKKMNELTDRIGMTNSNLVNVHGLDEKGHYSTAEDIHKLLMYCLKNPKFKEIYTTKEYQLSTGKIVKSTVKTTGNRIGKDTSRILGSKTGFTLGAGLCMSAIINSDNHEILIITLGATPNTGNTYHVLDTLELITFIDNSYNIETISKKDTKLISIPVSLSKIDTYDIKTTKDITKFLEKDYDKSLIKVEYKGKEKLSYKDKINTKIGTITYTYNQEIISTEEVILNIEIKPDYIKILLKYKYYILGFILIIIILIPKKKKRRILK
ncbi:MAG: D-alanyl-D-alanine carboxypeptidase [Firmicutes bacterium]|nr:D-alanyl-D-alanine carboxypeptidase [Bacillota bacterium]